MDIVNYAGERDRKIKNELKGEATLRLLNRETPTFAKQIEVT